MRDRTTTRLDELRAELDAKIERIAREVAREEIASLAGLVVRRTQEEEALLARIFGEALNDFTTDAEPGS
jgi:hypothetical protein